MNPEEMKAIKEDLQQTLTVLRAKAEETDKTSAEWVEFQNKANARYDALEKKINDAIAKQARAPGDGGEKLDPQEAEHRQLVLKAFRRGDSRMAPAEQARLQELNDIRRKALSVDSDPDGGYLVTPTQSQRIIERVWETSAIRSVATVETISTSDSLEGFNDLDEAGAGWVSERQERTETDTPEIGRWRIPVHEIYAEPRATQKVLDDAEWNLEEWLSRKVADKFARTENAAFVNGNGVGKPRGFLTYPDGTAWMQIERIPTGASGAWTPNAVWAMVYGIKAAYLPGAVWAMNRAQVHRVRVLRDDIGGPGTGQYMWAPGFGSEPSTLAGYPILDAPDMPTGITDTTMVAAFGNFREAYTIVDRMGIRVLRDPYTLKGFVKFYTTKRVGGDVLNFEALKILRVGAS